MSNQNKLRNKKISQEEWLVPTEIREMLGPISRWADPEFCALQNAVNRIRESDKLDLTTASDVQSRQKKFVYPNWVEEGEVTVMAGPGDGGKTTFQCTLAAGVTIGATYALHPELTPTGAGHVIMINQEDDFETTLRPCLEAAGANLEKVHFIGNNTAPGDDSPFSFSNERDLSRLMGLTERLGNNLGLIVVDPISFAVDGDPSNNYKARQAYERLTALAKRLDCAILGIAQEVENPAGRRALRRIAGPPALRHVPRAAMLLAKISDGPTETGGTHVLVHAKNKGRVDGGFEYRIAAVEIPGGSGTAPKFIVTRELTGSADDILDWADRGTTVNKLSKMDGAVNFLRTVLKDGSRPLIDIKKLAKDADIKLGTLLAAKAALKLVTRKRNGDGRSVWRLPDSADTSTSMD